MAYGRFNTIDDVETSPSASLRTSKSSVLPNGKQQRDVAAA
jgi:hypothetical protein